MSDPSGQPAAPAPSSGVAIVPRQDAPSQRQGALSPDEERQLGELIERRGKAAAGGMVRLRVEGPHESVRVGHTTVGREWTEVPEHMVAPLLEGAADAGVTITEES